MQIPEDSEGQGDWRAPWGWEVRHNLAIEWQQLKDLGRVPGTGGENCIEKPARILPWWESQCSGRDRKWWLIQKYINNLTRKNMPSLYSSIIETDHGKLKFAFFHTSMVITTTH